MKMQEITAPANESVPPRKSPLPIVSAVLTFAVPLFLYALQFGLYRPLPTLNLLMWLAPIVGLILAIVSLCLGKEQIGRSGVIISLTTLILAVILVATLIWRFLTSFTFSM